MKHDNNWLQNQISYLGQPFEKQDFELDRPLHEVLALFSTITANMLSDCEL